MVKLAKESGIKRVTVLSGYVKGSVEQAVRDTNDLEWAVLNPVEFMANTLEWTETIRKEDVVRQPFADVRY
ncbi:hypothetical protein HNR44_003410 [Geomicrobium halophilum]|uniref:Uncharacterized protein n=1 Tax=Geomicrobium halophilum TaxID=549000 RepID=A0A841Q0R0_9BACL|nr:hypothetical protein [Geomicrobium halophilum]MBB6451403.1 hypothetical protein [Geomicrobium halophilum]